MMRLSVFVLVAFMSSCAAQQKLRPWHEVRGIADTKATRQLPLGTLVGFTEPQGSMAWLGVPYAQPPVGPLRWKAPRPVLPWQGPREATKFGPLCPQLNGPLAADGSEGDVAGTEDCLTLNVFTPPFTADEAAKEKRPVMFWIHGGGNTIGTSNVYGIARNLALKHGVVVVSVNYRLGVLGWFHDPALISPTDGPDDNSGNFGTLDQLAALRWVSSHISTFGGDPDNVTIFGESAGGFDVFALLASPLAKGLFHRAISQSGMPATRTLIEASHFVDDAEQPGGEGSSREVLVMQLLRDGKAKDRAGAKAALAAMSSDEVATYLRGLTAQQLIAPFKATKPGFGMYRAPALLRDGHVLPMSTVVEALAQPTVPLLLGTNRDELKLFMLGNPQYVTRSIGLHINDEASFERDARLGADVWKALGTDLPAAAAQRAGTPVFAYRFDWDEEPSYLAADLPKLLGAAHGLELGFVFDDEAGEFDPFKINTKDNEPGRVKLARAMASYWVQFARSGSPGRGVDGALPEWTGYGPDARFMVLDTDPSGGPRMDQGAMQLDALEQRVWDDKTFDDGGRCAAIKAMFQGFGAASGAWTAERAARFAAKCR